MNAGHVRVAGLEKAELWSAVVTGQGPGAGLGKVIAWIRHEIAIRAAVARLEALPDELLQDIGIRRVDIDMAVRNARSREALQSA